MLRRRLGLARPLVALESQELIQFLDQRFVHYPRHPVLGIALQLLHQSVTDRVLEAFGADVFYPCCQLFPRQCRGFLTSQGQITQVGQDWFQIYGYFDLTFRIVTCWRGNRLDLNPIRQHAADVPDRHIRNGKQANPGPGQRGLGHQLPQQEQADTQAQASSSPAIALMDVNPPLGSGDGSPDDLPAGRFLSLVVEPPTGCQEMTGLGQKPTNGYQSK